jgi:hypothetical protein
MNLHGIVSGVISAVNPRVLVTLRKSAGDTIAADGSQVPCYQDFCDVPAQVQSLTYNDLQHISGLNVQGIRRAIYFYGNIEGLDRQAISGGDLVIVPPSQEFPYETTWLVVQQIEAWPGWSKCIVTLQNGG